MDEGADNLDELFEENETEEQNVETRNAENRDENETRVVPAPKRIVKNPRLKFNAERLCGERGIPVVVKHFKDVKFKGTGHEKEDLDKLLATLEHWTHRLFPSMKLEDCLHQIEKLGKKRPVQTCLRKIRLDMPILRSDFVQSDEERDEIQNMSEPEIQPQDVFDSLLEDHRKVVQDEVHVSTPVCSAPNGHILGTSSGSVLTEEQKRRMEYNKMLAAERRKTRLAAANSIDHNESLISSPLQAQELSLEDTNPQTEFDKLANSVTRMKANNGIECQIITNEVNNVAYSCDDLMAAGYKEISNELNKDSEVNSEKLEIDSLLNLVDEDETKKSTEDPVGSPVACDVNLCPQFSDIFDKLPSTNEIRTSNATLVESTLNINFNCDTKILTAKESTQNEKNFSLNQKSSFNIANQHDNNFDEFSNLPPDKIETNTIVECRKVISTASTVPENFNELMDMDNQDSNQNGNNVNFEKSTNILISLDETKKNCAEEYQLIINETNDVLNDCDNIMDTENIQSPKHSCQKVEHLDSDKLELDELLDLVDDEE